jgi:aspartyl-tRNA(Asn)/glutamyl-tRNA(Gln) amidotransferase subunit B
MVTSSPRTRTIVGLEIHVQLATRTKMFCGCAVRTDAPPNSCVCPVCLGHPGSLPVINRRAVEFAVRAGLALHCDIATFTKWDRKSYYYPDMPKNYQISQYDLPICANGHFDIPAEGGLKRIRIRRAHLEEDAGKNLHDVPGCTLVDLNRAGTPLLEIVTEPDIASADEAYAFATELQRLMVHLGVSEGNMQRGHMRFEPNVNLVIEQDGQEHRTPIAEVKNLNSFRSVRGAIAFEEQRQLHAWQEDQSYIFGLRPNENRGWLDDRGITEFQRIKEAAHDYRYFPDPDLVPVTLDAAWLGEVRASLPEQPVARRRRFAEQFGLATGDAETIVDHRPTADLFEAVIAAGGPAEVVGKQFVNVWLALAKAAGTSVVDLGLSAAAMAELAQITHEGVINRSAVPQIAEAMVGETRKRGNAETGPAPSPRAMAAAMGLVQVRDDAATAAWVAEAFAQNEQAVRDAVANPKKAAAAAGFLRGQVMKLSGGKADPKIVGRLIEERLANL